MFFLQEFVSYATIFLSSITSSNEPICKTYSGDAAWPSETTWQSLNRTVAGCLIVPVPVAAVCRSGETFDEAECTYITSRWHNTSWIAENPWLPDYNDISCPIEPSLPCDTDGYPAYVIEAIDEGDIQAGVNFAREHNIRLVIKGTGHDTVGRSSGAGSLSIWTHRIQGLDIVFGDETAVKYGGVASVKLRAGMRWGEVYKEMAKRNLTIVAGADPNVGVGGWILNGGHSPLSALYGLGADQVLSLDVVTADGRYLTVNETTHSDLFWALRGGGASSFAVMVSVTVKVYPQLDVTMHKYAYITMAGSDTYDSLVAYFHTHIPRISESGGMGYHYMVSSATLKDPSLAESYLLAGIWEFPGRTEAYVNRTMAPLMEGIRTADWAIDPIIISANNTSFPIHNAHWAKNVGEEAGVAVRLGSWLLDGDALTSDFAELKQQLKIAAVLPFTAITHVVGGPGLRSAMYEAPGGSNAVLPAWRNAYAHIDLVRSWPMGNQTLKDQYTADIRNSAMPALKKLAPHSGAYINECDPTNPEWKNDYFGDNYKRLLEVKHKYDPHGVFWCKPCVGWDEWEIRDGPSDENELEWVVGQGSGRLCKK